MIFSIELERLRDGRIKASTCTATDGLWAIRSGVSEAILAVSPSDTDIQLPETLALDDPEVTERVRTPDIALDGDTEAMRRLLTSAALSDRDVRMIYTDGDGNESERVVRPIKLDRGPQGRWLKAEDGGVVKSFYLHRIGRAGILQ